MNDLPAYLTNRPSRNLTDSATSGLGSARPPHVSRKDNKFTLIDAAGNSQPVMLMNEKGPFLDVVIVDANPNPSRVYYAGDYGDGGAAPDCFSDNGVAPSSQASSPQSPTCAGCPMAEWGSAVSKITGEGIPACSSSKKLAVLVVGDPRKMLYEFTVPAGSWNDKQTGWKRYTQSIAGIQLGNRSADLSDVITRIYFARTGVLGFAPVGMITQELADLVDAAWESGQTPAIVGLDDKPRNAALPIAPKPVAIPAPAPQATQMPVQDAQPMPPPNPPAEKKPRGRPAKSVQGTTDVPPFLPQRQPEGILPQGMPVSNTQAGIAQPLAVDEQMNAMLAQMFKLPT